MEAKKTEAKKTEVKKPELSLEELYSKVVRWFPGSSVSRATALSLWLVSRGVKRAALIEGVGDLSAQHCPKLPNVGTGVTLHGKVFAFNPTRVSKESVEAILDEDDAKTVGYLLGYLYPTSNMGSSPIGVTWVVSFMSPPFKDRTDDVELWYEQLPRKFDQERILERVMDIKRALAKLTPLISQ
ncbi:MAG: hypothetical protein OK454_11625, partial [Thaumarchaeota archaeon]|nr:hypothetical protein [Nitrososphaerota archaeon]